MNSGYKLDENLIEEKLAPIVIFAFNRPERLRKTVESLLLNNEVKESDLFVFVDGPRNDIQGEAEKVKAVQDYVKSIQGFKSIKYGFSEENRGLGNSVISGVTKVINQYGRVIVIEDDLVLSSNFLYFMNKGLLDYENNEKVFSICGYSNKIKVPADYYFDAYFCTRSSSWGWATWADRWKTVDWVLSNRSDYSGKKKSFNKWGGSDCYHIIKMVMEGKNDSWAIRFCFAQFLQNKISLFPIISKVANEGFAGDGTNFKKWSRFKFSLDGSGNKRFRFPTDTVLNETLYRSAMWYNSIPIRIWSRFMYFITQYL